MVEERLADDGCGLDGLSEPNLVSQQVALNRVFCDPPDNLDLVWEELDAGGEQAAEGPTDSTRSTQHLQQEDAAIRQELCLSCGGREHLRGVCNGGEAAHLQVSLDDLKRWMIGELNKIR